MNGPTIDGFAWKPERLEVDHLPAFADAAREIRQQLGERTPACAVRGRRRLFLEEQPQVVPERAVDRVLCRERQRLRRRRALRNASEERVGALAFRAGCRRLWGRALGARGRGVLTGPEMDPVTCAPAGPAAASSTTRVSARAIICTYSPFDAPLTDRIRRCSSLVVIMRPGPSGQIIKLRGRKAGTHNHYMNRVVTLLRRRQYPARQRSRRRRPDAVHGSRARSRASAGVLGDLRRRSVASLGYADYLGALQRYRTKHPRDSNVLTVSQFLINYRFANRLFPEIARRRRARPVVGTRR